MEADGKNILVNGNDQETMKVKKFIESSSIFNEISS